MNIDRDVPQGGLSEALRKLSYCLNTIEQSNFAEGMSWETNIVSYNRVTLEEMIGACVAAEQALNECYIYICTKDEEDYLDIRERRKIISRLFSGKHVVYFLHDKDAGLVKIGETSNLAKRLSCFTTYNPHKLYLLGIIEDEEEELEQYFHERFADYRVRGEWFLPNQELLSAIFARKDYDLWERIKENTGQGNKKDYRKRGHV